MKKKTLSNKEIRDLNDSLKIYNFSFDKKDNVELIEDKLKLVRSNNNVMFFYHNDKLIPSLKLVIANKINLKKVAVDMGAVKFVVNGADVMRPGITTIDDGINKDEVIAIVDTVNKKPLAIGISSLDSDGLKNSTLGKVIKNLHFVGDEIWKFGE